MIKHWFSDVKNFRHDPLNLILSKGLGSSQPIVSLALGPVPVFLVNDPETAKSLLKLSEAISDKGQLVGKLRAVLGKSTLTVSGEDHKKRRSVLHERLSRGVATGYVPEMLATIRGASLELTDSETFRADIFGASLALKLILVALFGHKALNSEDETLVMNAVNHLEKDLQSEMFRFLPRTPWRKYKDLKLRSEAMHAMGFIIDKVKARVGSSSVLSALTELGMSEEEIKAEITTMIIAGYHTTGAALTWATYFLSKEPQLVEKIRKEHESICDTTGEIDKTKLSNATVSLSFVKETLRLYPSAWWTTRELKVAHSVAGVDLKKGTTLIISPWLYQHSPKHFSEPDKFNPERQFNTAAFMPFGMGPRTCVGMGVAILELQLSVLELAATYNFETISNAEGLKLEAGITLSAPPIELGISLRGSESYSLREAA